MTIEQILHCIIETGKKYNCREIYLFGSRAKFCITFELVWKVLIA